MGREKQSLFNKKRESRRKREVKERRYRAETWLFLSEGKTEANYFKGLAEYLNKTSNIKIKIETHPLGTSTTRVVKKVEEFFSYSDGLYSRKRIKYAKVIFAFDKDSFDDFNNAISLAKQRYPDYIVAWSNESFELWLRLHFEHIVTGISRKQLNNSLTNLLRTHGILTKDQNYGKHGKGLQNIFNIIIDCGGSHEVAIRNAKKLLTGDAVINPALANPATAVHIAVEALINESQA